MIGSNAAASRSTDSHRFSVARSPGWIAAYPLGSGGSARPCAHRGRSARSGCLRSNSGVLTGTAKCLTNEPVFGEPPAETSTSCPSGPLFKRRNSRLPPKYSSAIIILSCTTESEDRLCPADHMPLTTNTGKSERVRHSGEQHKPPSSTTSIRRPDSPTCSRGLPGHPAKLVAELLPWNWRAQNLAAKAADRASAGSGSAQPRSLHRTSSDAYIPLTDLRRLGQVWPLLCS